jgi:hypothetical protein
MYPPPGLGQPITVVLRESDLNVSLVEAIEKARSPLDPPVFVVVDTFGVPNGTSIESATFEAKRRLDERTQAEGNMAVGYYWYAEAMARCTAIGVVSGTKRAPLGVGDLAYVAEALARHPEYKHQTLIQIARDGRIVRLVDGKVAIEGDVE